MFRLHSRGGSDMRTAASECLKLVLVVAFTIVGGSSFAQNSEITLIKSIRVGSQEGQIGYERSIAGGAPSPMSLFIASGEFYVIDGVNSRINVYNQQFSLIRTMRSFPTSLYECDSVIPYDGVFAATNPEYLYGVAPNGMLLFTIGRQDLWGDNPVNRQGLFPIGQYLFYYNSEDRVGAIDNNGKLIGRERAVDVLRTLPINRDSTDNLTAELLIAGTHIMLGARYLAPSYKKLLAHLDLVDPQGSQDRRALGSVVNARPVGFDEVGNSYWSLMTKGPHLLTVVFSSTGKLVRVIEYTSLVDLKKRDRTPYVTVSAAGTIYYMISRPSETLFFRTGFRWPPEQDTQ